MEKELGELKSINSENQVTIDKLQLEKDKLEIQLEKIQEHRESLTH